MEGGKEGNSPVGRCRKNRWTLWYTYTSYSHETETGILSWDFFVYVFFPPDPSPYRRQTLITFSRHQKNILGDFRTHSVEVLKLLHPPSFPLLSWKPTFGPRLPPAAVYNEASPANAVHLHTDIDNPKNTFSVLPYTLRNEGLLIRVLFYGIISPTVFLPPPSLLCHSKLRLRRRRWYGTVYPEIVQQERGADDRSPPTNAKDLPGIE